MRNAFQTLDNETHNMLRSGGCNYQPQIMDVLWPGN
jgi:hypothetical protein